jgi:hypothetical protein
MAVADFLSSAVGCAAWAHAIAAPQPITAPPQIIPNHRIKNRSLPRTRVVQGPILQGKWSRHAAAALKAYSQGNRITKKWQSHRPRNLERIALKGHGFSRAVELPKKVWPSGPEGWG